MQKDKYTLQSVDNALAILELLAAHEELSALDVAKLLRMGKSTAFRLLSTLTGRNFVTKTKESKYRLSLKVSALGAVATERIEIISAAHQELARLAREVKETTHLVVWIGDGMVQFVDKVASPTAISMASMVGMRMRAHLTATGKVLLANRPEEEQERYLRNIPFEQVTPHTIISPGQLRAELEGVRKNGYGTDFDESEIGLTCCAAPIRDFSGTVIAALSISGSSSRMEPTMEDMIRQVMAAARNISEKIR
jgi:DNA-binding IclR family transcriptional regulator